MPLTFDELAERLDGVKFMSAAQARRLWRYIDEHDARDVLDIGTCYGASAAWAAGALAVRGGGTVLTVDSAQFDDLSSAREWAHEVWDRCAVRSLISEERITCSSYAWWLLEQADARRGRDGRVTPAWDLVYLDGAKSLTLDGTAAMLLLDLIRPGGCLLLDDVGWSYAGHDTGFGLRFGEFEYQASQAELERPHVRAVCEALLRHDPRVARLEYEGDWARVTLASRTPYPPARRRWQHLARRG